MKPNMSKGGRPSTGSIRWKSIRSGSREEASQRRAVLEEAKMSNTQYRLRSGEVSAVIHSSASHRSTETLPSGVYTATVEVMPNGEEVTTLVPHGNATALLGSNKQYRLITATLYGPTPVAALLDQAREHP